MNYSKLICLFFLGFISTAAYTLPFTIQAVGSLPTQAPSTATYTIIKNTPLDPTGNIIKWLPPFVSISAIGTTCATSLNTPFFLAYNERCTLTLTISGPINRNDPDPQNHLMICLSDQTSCSGPNPDNSLNVIA